MNSTILPPTELKFLTADQVAQYHRDGYVIVRGLLTADEVKQMRDKLDSIGAAGKAIPHSWDPDLTPEGSRDPLKRYPRVMMPHRYDEFSLHMLLHPHLVNIVHDLFSEEPLAAQSMYYFKPPGARGQALHQDDYYLLTAPDVPFVQDGLRDGEHIREWMDRRFAEQLAHGPAPVVRLSGPYEQRFEQAVTAVERLLGNVTPHDDPRR